MTWQGFVPIVFLAISNVFMTFAWYGQLKFPDRPLWIVVLVSWGIAFVEYCFAVPANRIGYTVYSAAELKTMQEIITLLCLCRIFRALPQRGDTLESCRRFRLPGSRGLLHLLAVVISIVDKNILTIGTPVLTSLALNTARGSDERA